MTLLEVWKDRLEAATARNVVYKNQPGTSNETISRSDSVMMEASLHLSQKAAAAARERGNRRGLAVLGQQNK